MKLVVSDKKTGKSYSVEVAEDKRSLFVGKRMGDTVQGDDFGLFGYTLKLSGGSDTSGMPMRRDISGSRKMKVLLSGGQGFNPTRKGMRKKKMVRGNLFSADNAQVNVVVESYGQAALDGLLKKEEKK
ncbi:MAG: 30S ribosomal protein S6e [Candidatus ainarchaeum sp.]|nr:30S ribosomal protein S6e [Candidatus ainarchaeum sp.]MDD5096216.1 30S ribosomal protein S6e [Candidatus ainarchaeum sp.]